jgi:hypothetical protein
MNENNLTVLRAGQRWIDEQSDVYYIAKIIDGRIVVYRLGHGFYIRKTCAHLEQELSYWGARLCP